MRIPPVGSGGKDGRLAEEAAVATPAFDFETLATYTYQYAKDEMLEEAALPALMVVMAGLIPVILMNRMLRRAG